MVMSTFEGGIRGMANTQRNSVVLIVMVGFLIFGRLGSFLPSHLLFWGLHLLWTENQGIFHSLSPILALY